MSILIKGMEMPNACIDCPLFSEWGDCSITHKWTWSDEFPLSENRMSDCPLVELPTPHGRLIDADHLADLRFHQAMHDDDGLLFVTFVEVARQIFNTPTIIEAEGVTE